MSLSAKPFTRLVRPCHVTVSQSGRPSPASPSLDLAAHSMSLSPSHVTSASHPLRPLLSVPCLTLPGLVEPQADLVGPQSDLVEPCLASIGPCRALSGPQSGLVGLLRTIHRTINHPLYIILLSVARLTVPPKTPPFDLLFSVSPSIARTPVANAFSVHLIFSASSTTYKPHTLHHLTQHCMLYNPP
jgi:hypothetical protein